MSEYYYQYQYKERFFETDFLLDVPARMYGFFKYDLNLDVRGMQTNQDLIGFLPEVMFCYGWGGQYCIARLLGAEEIVKRYSNKEFYEYMQKNEDSYIFAANSKILKSFGFHMTKEQSQATFRKVVQKSEEFIKQLKKDG